jgi:outer membrane protein OmpA-like peptidoglycan-associated protein
MRNDTRQLFLSVCLTLVVGLGYVGTAHAFQIQTGKKTTVQGKILSRSGDLVKISVKKTGALVVVNLSENTKVERTGGTFGFRHQEMDITAMVPGLTIEAQGVGNAQGQLDAKTIKFDPNVFAVEVAEEQQITANQAAASKAQSTANQGVAAAGAAQASANGAQTSANQAQSSANQAQASANQAGAKAAKAQASANTAGALGVMDADAIAHVNKRVSDLDDYKTVAVAGIYFPSDGTALDDAAKADLAKLAQIALPLDGYMIEIAGYASSTGSKDLNQKLGSERAAAVTQYLRDKQNVPMRRMLAPASYGSTHPDATNSDPDGRALNRRVDVTVLVNKGLNQ